MVLTQRRNRLGGTVVRLFYSTMEHLPQAERVVHHSPNRHALPSHVISGFPPALQPVSCLSHLFQGLVPHLLCLTNKPLVFIAVYVVSSGRNSTIYMPL